MSRVIFFMQEIKVEHSVFALPFAIATCFLVFGGWPDGAAFGWIVLAMISARTIGMAANRLIDAEIDARNPRTASRGLPSDRLKARHVVAWIAVSLALFGIAVSQLDELAWYLSPLVIIALAGYPYAKRFTWMLLRHSLFDSEFRAPFAGGEPDKSLPAAAKAARASMPPKL